MATFFGFLKLAAFRNFDHVGGFVAHALGHVLHLLDNIIAFKDFPEDNMFTIQPAGDGCRNEELERLIRLIKRAIRYLPYLRAVGILSRIGHT